MRSSVAYFLLVCGFSSTVGAVEVTNTLIERSKAVSTISVADTAKAWNLTDSDVKKYNKIMSGTRGVFSPGIAPPLALALEAKTPEERKKYLVIYAKLEQERTQKDLATSRMYKQVFDELFPEPVIDKSFLYEDNKNYIRDGDRFVIFINLDCTKCKGKLLTGLIKTSNFKNIPTDIYVKGAKTSGDLQRWAREMGINSEKVAEGRITLNLLKVDVRKSFVGSEYSMYVLRDDALHSFSN